MYNRHKTFLSINSFGRLISYFNILLYTHYDGKLTNEEIYHIYVSDFNIISTFSFVSHNYTEIIK